MGKVTLLIVKLYFSSQELFSPYFTTMIDIYFQGKNGQRCMELCEYLMGAVPTTNNAEVFLEPFVTENDLENINSYSIIQ